MLEINRAFRKTGKPQFVQKSMQGDFLHVYSWLSPVIAGNDILDGFLTSLRNHQTGIGALESAPDETIIGLRGRYVKTPRFAPGIRYSRIANDPSGREQGQ